MTLTLAFIAGIAGLASQFYAVELKDKRLEFVAIGCFACVIGLMS